MYTSEEAERLQYVLAELGLYSPPKIDFMINGVCPLRCDGCWGPDWRLRGNISAAQWVQAAGILSYAGLEEVVISGGEPLLRRDLEEIVIGCRDHWLRVTLSSICHGILDRPDILNNIVELGVPLDGSTPEENARSRPALNPSLNARSFWDSIIALREIPKQFPRIEITLRTVVDGFNGNRDYAYVLAIPLILEKHGIDLSLIRWKLYQWNRYVGPRQDRSNQPHPRDIEDSRFNDIVNAARLGGQFLSVTGQSARFAAGHYFLFEPDGEARLETTGPDGLPCGVHVGHVSDLQTTLTMLHDEHHDAMLHIYQRREAA